MRPTFHRSVALAAFLVFAAGAFAQRDYDHYHQDRDDRFKDDRWQSRIFSQVRQDLDHVQFATWGGRDRYRIVQTKQELDELQDGLARSLSGGGGAFYDQRRLDDVIGALRRVVADNRMSPRDREILNDDLRRLADYREHHEGWGRR